VEEGQQSGGDQNAQPAGQDNRDAVIKRLQESRTQARAKLTEQDTVIRGLSERLANLEGRLTATNTPTPNESETGGLLRNASEDVLRQAYSKGGEAQDTGLQFEALTELISRSIRNEMQNVPSAVESSLLQKDHRQRVIANLEESYKEMLDPDAPEYGRAHQIALDLKKTYGDDVLQKYPELYELALLKVKATQLPELQKALHERGQENEKLKRQLQSTIDGVNAPPLNDASKEALSRGDTDGAVKAIAARLLGG
jgi:hypothetical protein